MHIAVCDDNVADRKQTERLMGREADKWIKSGDPLYVFSYGSVASLLDNSMQFDAVLIDVSESPEWNIKTVVEKLGEKGVNRAVVICSREKDPDTELSEQLLFLQKPIVPAELHELMLKVKQLSENSIPRIELRGVKETLYVSEDDIVCAEGTSEETCVTLADGKEISIHGRAESFFDENADRHPAFVMPGSNTVINIKYVEKIRLGKAYMANGKIFRVPGGIARYIKDNM